MKLKELLENIENGNIVTKYPFTRFVINGYLSFFDLVEEFELSEERLYFPQGRVSPKGQKYNYLVKVMKSDLDKIIEEVDELVGRCPRIFQDFEFTKTKSSTEFVKSMHRLLEWVEYRVLREKQNLDTDKIEQKLSLIVIKRYTEINKEIKAFNLLLIKLEKIFSTAIDSDYESIIFNEKVPEFDLLMNTLSLRISLLKIPSEPILPLEESENEDLGPWTF